MGLRAFPVLYTSDVEKVAAFYRRLGFKERSRLPGQDGSAGFIGLRRDGAELAVTTDQSPRVLAGVEPGPGPRHELFVYVPDVDTTVSDLRSTRCTARPTAGRPPGYGGREATGLRRPSRITRFANLLTGS